MKLFKLKIEFCTYSDYVISNDSQTETQAAIETKLKRNLAFKWTLRI